MTIDATALFAENALQPAVDNTGRFGGRWRLVGAGLSNIWRYGDLELPAESGRLLIRGPNGTGKTTALEALWPYLLDLNAGKLAAGKARHTTLKLLMSEGAVGKRRYGYTWITFAAPDTNELQSYGVRLQYSEGASPAVRAIPFTVPGRPLHGLSLHGPGRAALTVEQFTESVDALGGQVFDDSSAYVTDMAARLWHSTPGEMNLLAARLREVRNPTLLGEVSPRGAADALRASLPGVADDVITATADALEGSAATREAFARDRADAAALREFAELWAGHVVEVTNAVHSAAEVAAGRETQLRGELRHHEKLLTSSRDTKTSLTVEQTALGEEQQELAGHIEALQNSEPYKQAGVLTQLRETLTAQEAAAGAEIRALQQAARGIAQETQGLRSNLTTLSESLEAADASALESDPTRASAAALVEVETRPAEVLTVGEDVADPGPVLLVRADPTALRAVAEEWQATAESVRQQAERAQMLVVQHKPVEQARKRAEEADKAAEHAVGVAERSAVHAVDATAAAKAAAAGLLDAAAAWCSSDSVRQLRTHITAEQDPDAADEVAAGLVEQDEIDEQRGAESAAVLEAAEEWAARVQTEVSAAAAELRQQASIAQAAAQQHRGQAGVLRAEAEALRSGRLLPLPRPAWLDVGDDSDALGNAIEWQPAVPQAERDRLEAALAASGVLAAGLSSDGANASRWRVHSDAAEQQDSLAAVLRIDYRHPHAAVAELVLRRIALVDTATALSGDSELVIGRDGTFRTGAAIGTPDGAAAGEVAPKAQYIGAAQRRAAALAQADELERQAGELDRQANVLDEQAQATLSTRTVVLSAGSTFPGRQALRTAEGSRAAAARTARDDRSAADELAGKALAEHAEHQRLRSQWVDNVVALGLTPELDTLARLAESGQHSAKQLRDAAAAVAGRHVATLERLLAGVSSVDERRAQLPGQHAHVRDVHALATRTASKLATLEAESGSSVTETLEELHTANSRHGEIGRRLSEINGLLQAAIADHAKHETNVAAVEASLREAQPAAEAALHALRRHLAAPGVGEVVLGTHPLVEDDLLEQIRTAIIGRKTTVRRTLLIGYDDARAKLAGTWALDNAEPLGDLLSYTLTRRDTVYTAPQAAQRAEHLAEQAEQALAAAEEEALSEFIIGRLPNAISTAWTQLHDWVKEVNKKMRSATASSGVGVQVRVHPSDHMSPSARRVYELACKTSLALRTDEENAELGRALQSLIDAADGETMTERIAAGVDVREWVDVHYEITRPGSEKVERWGQRTGLSGGERRLVVLAPMLAAVAAAYDRSPATSARLAALDEVPAEVDEQGRESLARYLAALDLDLICTSYLWDGAPGAWDGIDAHDLEAAPDGTVVAFPMLIRGDELLPGDPGAPDSTGHA
ncbi:MAG: SbcC/MukB-like Walker B domain-containing protein [Mycobacteriales bacterium]